MNFRFTLKIDVRLYKFYMLYKIIRIHVNVECR